MINFLVHLKTADMYSTRRDTGFDSDITSVDETMLQSASSVDRAHNVAADVGTSRRISRFTRFGVRIMIWRTVKILRLRDLNNSASSC